MSIFDLSLLIILLGFIVNGLFKGLIRMLGHIVGLFIGSYITGRYYLIFFNWWKDLNWFQAWTINHESFAKIISFIVLFILVTRASNLFFILLEKVFNFMAIIPGSRFINNILGALFGFLEGALFLGLILYIISAYSLINNYFSSQLASSVMAPMLLAIVHIILPLLPSAFKSIQAIV